MFPHERSLVKRMAEEKNRCPRRHQQRHGKILIKKQTKSKKLPGVVLVWEKGTSGPIHPLERQGLADVVLIDHKGVIRHKFVGNPATRSWTT